MKQTKDNDRWLIRGRVWTVGDSVNTDAMYPGFAMKLPPSEAAKHVFHELRPGWADQVAPGDLVVAGRNFGVGSSRPVPVLFQELGVSAVVAEEFNSLFLRNCVNSGLPALSLPGVTELCEDGDTMQVHVAEGWCRNERTGAVLRGSPSPPMVLELLEAGGVLPRLAKEGYLPTDVARLLLSD